jgi:hypothetical protein
MNDYIVLIVEPLSSKRKVDVFRANTLEDAKKVAKSRKSNSGDVIIAKKSIHTNKFNGEEEEVYTIERYGYYKVYNFMNKIFLLLSVVLFALFTYLYFKFLNQKNI